MTASRSMRRLPSSDCSASRLCGGSRSMIVGVAATIASLAPSRELDVAGESGGGVGQWWALSRPSPPRPVSVPDATNQPGRLRLGYARNLVGRDGLPNFLGDGSRATGVENLAVRTGNATLVDPLVLGAVFGGDEHPVMMRHTRLGVALGA